MSRLKLPSIALITLVSAGCGGGGLNFWLYPEPHLAETEEALFVAYESHQLQSIDGEETKTRCWGEARGPQPYSRQDVLCRLHLRPGQHSVVLSTMVNDQQRVSLDFTAEAGKVYGLDRSGCTPSGDARQRTCLVKIVEIEGQGGPKRPQSAEEASGVR